MKTNHENWLLEQLAGMAQHFPAHDLPNMRRDENDTTQAAALHDLRAAAEMRHAADAIITDKLAPAQRTVEALRDKISEMRDLIAAGKSALREGRPVDPECGVAGYLLPDLDQELAVAESVVSGIQREHDTLIHDAGLRDNAAARQLGELCTARRVLRVEALLRIALEEAAQLAADEAAAGRYTLKIAVDSRLARVVQHQGQIEILRRNRGM